MSLYDTLSDFSDAFLAKAKVCALSGGMPWAAQRPQEGCLCLRVLDENLTRAPPPARSSSTSASSPSSSSWACAPSPGRAWLNCWAPCRGKGLALHLSLPRPPRSGPRGPVTLPAAGGAEHPSAEVAQSTATPRRLQPEAWPCDGGGELARVFLALHHPTGTARRPAASLGLAAALLVARHKSRPLETHAAGIGGGTSHGGCGDSGGLLLLV